MSGSNRRISGIAAVITVIIVVAAHAVYAQQVYPPVPAMGVNYTTLNFSVAQSYNSLINGANYCMVLLYLHSSQEQPAGPVMIRGTGTLSLGGMYVNTDVESGVRVIANEVSLEAMAIYPVGWPVNPYAAANARSPVTESFANSGFGRYRYAKFWDPATTLQGTGFAYTLAGRSGVLATRVGLAVRQIRGRNHTFLTDDPETKEVETYLSQTGIESATNLYLNIDSTTTCNAQLNLFSSFDDLDVWTVRFDSGLKFQFAQFLAFEWRLQILHDILQSRRTQFTHVLTFGLTHTFL